MKASRYHCVGIPGSIALSLLMSLSASGEKSFDEFLQPMMESYCYKCHDSEKMKGDVDLTIFTSESQMRENRKFWRLTKELIEEEEMPSKAPFPTDEEREEMVTWIDSVVNDRDWFEEPHPGHVTIARLTKTEYANTMRDLIGMDFGAADEFSEDGEGRSGFDNDRDALSVTPALIEKYFAGADKALSAAMAMAAEPIKIHWESEKMFMTETKVEPIPFPGESAIGHNIRIGQMTLYDSAEFPVDGKYRFKIRARLTGRPLEGVLRIDNEEVGRYSIGEEEAKLYEMVVEVKGGARQIALNKGNYLTKEKPKPGIKPNFEGVHIDWIEIEGPLAQAGQELRVFQDKPSDTWQEAETAQKTLSTFGSRAFRRPITDDELAKYVRLFALSRKAGAEYNEALKNAYAAILVSPAFFFRSEEVNTANQEWKGAYRLDPYAFISRLSYFLWLSMPDDELFALATTGEIYEPEVLSKQVKRMLLDDRSKSFTSLFLGQWLGFRALGESVIPDAELFPEYSPSLNAAAKQEPVLLLDSLFRKGGSLLELISSDRTFVNSELADFYGIEGVKGDEMREIRLNDPKRGGLVGMTSVLTATSTPVRTSPVIRGVWVLEKLLGERVPEPPEAVPALPSDDGEHLGITLRQELETHRNNEACMSCHMKIDPIGFGLEDFDAIGRFRETDSGLPIDNVGVMPDGSTFQGSVELKEYLMKNRREDFITNMTERMLSFALGRELGEHDKPSVIAIFNEVARENCEATKLVEAVVFSYPFQYNSDKPLIGQ
ncbi:MAG: DUF1592 domain-containing protein [Akkermansiaceae bacterium]|jgi:hypothetical protein|nr:DUF1592 domain-containing protein [Akkermansiaceae bacterium]MDP4646566.1 DUF1592 domain-containing protein [Akkermansiaceae bacterium]MDP4720785.1 DUF1592 domain-containing protein [Akkermansiaceae bacterium]MDP4781120.1 DUF1592 domain-containing protein [Akkermansiaceae bacterium]MDP4846437.1 DUF1592 domain-containing protein [Akkermansiaceae bacterium]